MTKELNKNSEAKIFTESSHAAINEGHAANGIPEAEINALSQEKGPGELHVIGSEPEIGSKKFVTLDTVLRVIIKVPSNIDEDELFELANGCVRLEGDENANILCNETFESLARELTMEEMVEIQRVSTEEAVSIAENNEKVALLEITLRLCIEMVDVSVSEKISTDASRCVKIADNGSAKVLWSETVQSYTRDMNRFDLYHYRSVLSKDLFARINLPPMKNKDLIKAMFLPTMNKEEDRSNFNSVVDAMSDERMEIVLGALFIPKDFAMNL